MNQIGRTNLNKLYAYEENYAQSEIYIGRRADVYDVFVRSSAKRLAD